MLREKATFAATRMVFKASFLRLQMDAAGNRGLLSTGYVHSEYRHEFADYLCDSKQKRSPPPTESPQYHVPAYCGEFRV